MKLSQQEILDIAARLLKEYGSKSETSKHSIELVSKYGKDQFARIIAAAKCLREEKRWRKPNTPEKKKMNSLLGELKSRYRVGARYAFVVVEKRLSPVWSYVEDQYEWRHPVDLPARFQEGDEISCIVRGYFAKISDNRKPIVNLKLNTPRKLPAKISVGNFEVQEPKQYVCPPEKWAAEVEGLSKHICGKPFTCSCCGQEFNAREGYKIDFREIYFCKDCKREIYPTSGRGWYGKIIPTPMGNKR